MKVFHDRTQLLNELNQICTQTLKEKSRVMISINAPCGSGKSTLGKYIRKNGFGNFKPYQIAVVDDNRLTLNLFILHPKIRIAPSANLPKDNLKPFMKFIPPYTKIILCISGSPTRIDFADVIITIEIDEDRRRKQLEQREKDQELAKSLYNFKTKIDIPFTHWLCWRDK